MIKDCINCQKNFEIDQQDQDFYERIGVPKPTHCPFCRQNRRLAFRNERFLYKDKCDLCNQGMISIFSEDSPYTVYCNECWNSDKWDPTDYGRDYDPNRSFFEQFVELQKEIPFFALHQDKESVNCQYVNYGLGNKNCYLALCAYSEDVYYSHGMIKDKNCMDCMKLVGSELCYDCVDCSGCYNLLFSQDCQNCSDSYFLQDCVSCKNCFCCVGLRNKEYYFMNEKLSPEEYKKRVKEIKLSNESIKDWYKKLHAASLKVPKKYIHGNNNQNVTGDYIDNCKDLKDCYDCLDEVEKMAYCELCGLKCHDCYDVSNAGLGTELCYECHGIVGSNNCKFIYYANGLQDSEYCHYCYSSDHLFGCIGLTHKSHHILNKKYTPEDYQKLRSQIIENMKRDKEWGEFFPFKISKFPYSETVAAEYAPLKQEAVPEPEYEREADKDPNALSCKLCSKKYKIISKEKEFYKRFKLPTPESCYDCRHKIRFHKRNKRELHNRQCNKCTKPIRTTYAPDQPEIVYCQDCYLETIY